MKALRRVATVAGVACIGAWLGVAVRRVMRRRTRIEWQPPRGINHHGVLAARVLGSGPPVVLLHGLTASNRYWGAAFDALGTDNRLIVPDLLGFGASVRPATGYSPLDHATAVSALLSELHADDRAALLAGHSTGCLVALHLAQLRPELVGGIVAFAPPLYESRQQAEQHIAALGFMARIFALDTTTARRACRWVCDHRELAGRASVLFRPELLAPIAHDGVQHTWPSYSETLEHVILAADTVTLVESSHVPVRFVIGDSDPVADRALLGRLAQENDRVSLAVWPDRGHDLPLTAPSLAVEVLRSAIAALRPDSARDADLRTSRGASWPRAENARETGI